jgi:hypothetical protein
VSGFGPNRAALVDVLSDAFPNPEMLHAFAFMHLNLNIRKFTDGPLLNAIIALVEWAESGGHESRLLAALREARDGHEMLMIQVAICEAHLERTGAAVWYWTADPFDACILKGHVALFNRNELRRALKQLEAQEGRNVLVVRGERGLGCSHSLELVVHLRAQLRNFRLASVDLETVPADVEPRSIVIDIAQQLNIAAPPPPRDGQAPRWNHDLVSWLVGDIEAADEPAWIVIDGFDHISPRQEIVELVTSLAERAARKCVKLRVILLGWSAMLPPPLEARVLHERIMPMRREVMDDFFTQFLEHKKQPPSPETVRRAVETLEQEVSGDYVGDLRRISAGAVAIARTMASPEREP